MQRVPQHIPPELPPLLLPTVVVHKEYEYINTIVIIMSMSNNCSVDDIIKLFILPEEIIRNIASYLIMKIPKNDPRYQVLESHYHDNKEHRVNVRLYPVSRNYFTYYITFSNTKMIFSITRYYDYYMLYQFKNTVTGEVQADQCWFKLEDMNWRRDSTNYWRQLVIDGWLPNPNTTILQTLT